MNTYCVLCGESSAARDRGRRTVHFYLGAASSNDALAAAAQEFPGLRILGIEPHDCTSITQITQNAA
jgi:hypothetical protein